MNVSISKEKVLEAANKYPQAKETLKILFPEVFKNDKYLDLSKLAINDKFQLFTTSSIELASHGIHSDLINIRQAEEYKDKGFLLSYLFNWIITVDSTGHLILLPTKKQ